MRVTTSVAAMALMAGLSGCGGSQGSQGGARPEPGDATPAESSAPSRTTDPKTPCAPAGSMPADSEAASEMDAGHYDPALFDAAAAATNRWYPLRPGVRLFYRGSSVEDGERLHHTVDVVVTDLVKVVDGVPNVVVWERDYTEGELVESELALFATDRHGNVWHMGEYPEEYEDGKLDATPAWVHGLEGACAGVTLPGEPRTGSTDYAQGFAPRPINWVDRGRVYRTAEETCVPAGCYQDVVVIEEFETGLPDAYQDKYYAPGVGVVRVGWRGSKDESKEVLKLVSVGELSGPELGDARSDALRLEQRAYRLSKDVWAKTAPATPAG